MGNVKNVYICVTPYHLYISLLLIGNNIEESYLLLNANNDKIYKQFTDIALRLQKKGYKVDTRKRNALMIERGNSRKQFKKVFSSERHPVFSLYNFAWNCQYVYSTADLFYKKCTTAYFVEEGVMLPLIPPRPHWRVMIKKILGNAVDFYKDKKLDGIYVQKPETYPIPWKSKLKLLNINNLSNSIDSEAKKRIVNAFLGDLEEKLLNIDNNTVGIIYTQPLSEDSCITEDEKIRYYEKMVKYYGKEAPVFLKVHPRDTGEYKVDNNCTILPAYFPSELLNLLKIHFRFAIGICSSAVVNTAADIKMNLNENFLIDKKFDLLPLQSLQ